MTLTPKQEKFCLKYLECSNASEAYRFAYSCEKMKDKQVWEEASKLLANPKVAQRIQELQAQIALRAIATKEDKLHRLEDIIESPTSKPSEVISAIKVHNEMTGHNAPTKTEITGKDGAPLLNPNTVDLSTLSEQQLRELQAILQK